MMKRYALLSLLALVFALAGPRPIVAGAARPSAKPSVCGPAMRPLPFTQPPDVDVWTLPANASGEHELILAVHRDGDRFCYRYRFNGVVQTVSPTIRVHRGEHFALRIVNDISGQSKGEYVASTALPKCMPMPMPNAPVVHYVGYLNHVIDDRWMPKMEVDTNIHLHGFEGPAAQENVFLSTLSTPMHACEYEIAIPKTQPPGTYFYHPHVHGGSGVEMAGGLAGVWIVEPDSPQIAPSADHVIVLRYEWPFANDNNFQPDPTAIFLTEIRREASLKPAKPVAYDPFAPPPWPLAFPMTANGFSLDPQGCNGVASDSRLSVDGYAAPATLDVPGGEDQVLRIVNETPDSAKVVKLRDSDGKPVALRIVELDGVPVGGDMAHPLARYITSDRLMLAPSSRASILVTAAPGQTLRLSTTHFCEGTLAFFQTRQELLHIVGTAQPAGDPGPSVTSAPANVADSPASKLVAYAHANPSLIHRRAITFTEYVFPKHGKIPPHSSYYITDTTNANFHEHAYYPLYNKGDSVPVNADIVVKQGTIEEWYLFNTTMESHVFHIHQMAFVEKKGPAGAPATVDSMFVPVGQLLPNRSDPNYPLVKPSVTKVLLDFRTVPRGTFVFHCHMLFHEDRGMMGIIRVV